VIKSRKMRWAGHVARVEVRRVADRVSWGNPRGRGHLEDIGVDGRIILKVIFNKLDGDMDWIDLAQDMDR
jgi:hypothetical protein